MSANGVFDSVPGDDERRISEAVQQIADRRAVIDQAKGMLMLTYGIDADRAFELLRWQSQHHNVKLRLIAEQVMKDLLELAQSRPFVQRVDTETVLLTAHERIDGVQARPTNGQYEIAN